jgi:hypothetical protein
VILSSNTKRFQQAVYKPNLNGGGMQGLVTKGWQGEATKREVTNLYGLHASYMLTTEILNSGGESYGAFIACFACFGAITAPPPKPGAQSLRMWSLKFSSWPGQKKPSAKHCYMVYCSLSNTLHKIRFKYIQWGDWFTSICCVQRTFHSVVVIVYSRQLLEITFIQTLFAILLKFVK